MERYKIRGKVGWEGIRLEGRGDGKVYDKREGGMERYKIREKVGWKGIRLEGRWNGKVKY